jgi:hypothetical protein
MAAWSVYLDSGREIRRYKSKASAINAVESPRTFMFGLRALKTFDRWRRERVVPPRKQSPQ